jgi:DNA-binding winged helix-turn-helix (wHTH) protein/tetratricopeptide (TPR) repeat protein
MKGQEELTADNIHQHSSSSSVDELGVVYRFADFSLDAKNRLLFFDHDEIAITGRALDTLIFLVLHAGQLVTKNELMEAVWENRFVEESNLTVAISTLRKAISVDREGRKFIQTVSGQGYRFVGTVEVVQPTSLSSSDGIVPTGNLTPVTLSESYPSSQPVLAPSRAGSHQKVRLVWTIAALLALLLATGIFFWKSDTLSSAPHLQSIAILPISGHGTEEFILQGMTESIIARAAGRIVVRPINSVLRYSGTPTDVERICREQAVDAVVVGVFKQDASSARLDLKLVLTTGRTLWSKSFTSGPSDLQQLQETASLALNDELLHFTAHSLVPSKRQDHRHIPSDQAYRLYMRGRYLWNLRTDEGLHQGIEYFRQSIAADPDYALAYAGLADSYVLQGATAAKADARAAALSAIHLDPDLAEPHASLGMIYFFSDWNAPQSEKEFQRSIALNPNYATAHEWFGLELAARGYLSKALYQMQSAQNLDPLSLVIGTDVGWTEYLQHDYDGAIAEYQRVLELDPGFVRALVRTGYARLRKGDTAGAVQQMRAAQKLTNAPYVLALLGYAEAMNGDKASAENILRQLRASSGNNGGKYVPSFELSLVCLALHRNEEALQLLNEAVGEHATGLVYAKVDPSLDPLRGDPRFTHILAKMQF